MDIDILVIPTIELRWSPWIPWDRFLLDARSHPDAVAVPNESGVYEARDSRNHEMLTIGKASDLRMRVKQGLVKGYVPHSAGKRVRQEIEASVIEIRWAITDRPSCAEEELHRRYLEVNGHLPPYTRRT